MFYSHLCFPQAQYIYYVRNVKSEINQTLSLCKTTTGVFSDLCRSLAERFYILGKNFPNYIKNDETNWLTPSDFTTPS